jgi:hypothetical protein
VAEGLGPGEVAKEIAEHKRHADDHGHAREEATGRDRIITIIEATLLAMVALLAAWSGFAAAKWSTESRLLLAQANTARTEANRAIVEADGNLNFDAETFDAWFMAYLLDNRQGMEVAERRFRPEFEGAFAAWMATDPFNNPDAPPGPTYMPEYEQPERESAAELDAQADERYAEGAEAGETADQYVRITVFLATVLFLVGISGHFPVRGARYGLIAVGAVILTVAVILLIAAPKPP